MRRNARKKILAAYNGSTMRLSDALDFYRTREPTFPVDRTSELLDIEMPPGTRINLWDEYFAPRYGEPNDACIDAVRLLAETEGLLLDPVYTGKAMAGLIDGVTRGRFDGSDPVLFLHTGGAPALFAYRDALRAG